jgi:ubiquinone/menaquinone biosynthesis C-methylase UbiE
MGFYRKLIVPLLLDLAMRNRLLDPYRRRAVDLARGVVLEVGIGSGLNLPLYSPAITHVIAIDPSAELLQLARQRVAQAQVRVSLIRGSAEHLPFDNAVFDTVVMTWTLCSIPDPRAGLAEIRRVLKAGGRLLFVEHGLSPEAPIARWQAWLTPFWSKLSGGCHLDRQMDDLIRAAGFDTQTIEAGYMPGPKPWTFMYQGRAVR